MKFLAHAQACLIAQSTKCWDRWDDLMLCAGSCPQRQQRLPAQGHRLSPAAPPPRGHRAVVATNPAVTTDAGSPEVPAHLPTGTPGSPGTQGLPAGSPGRWERQGQRRSLSCGHSRRGSPAQTPENEIRNTSRIRTDGKNQAYFSCRACRKWPCFCSLQSRFSRAMEM